MKKKSFFKLLILVKLLGTTLNHFPSLPLILSENDAIMSSYVGKTETNLLYGQTSIKGKRQPLGRTEVRTQDLAVQVRMLRPLG